MAANAGTTSRVTPPTSRLEKPTKDLEAVASLSTVAETCLSALQSKLGPPETDNVRTINMLLEVEPGSPGPSRASDEGTVLARLEDLIPRLASATSRWHRATPGAALAYKSAPNQKPARFSHLRIAGNGLTGAGNTERACPDAASKTALWTFPSGLLTLPRHRSRP
jgi:hypothetical protein